MRHTPGPWSIVYAAPGEDPDCGIIAPNCANVIAETFSEFRQKGLFLIAEAKANAILIAAAPDMVELLQEVCEALHDLPADLPTAKSYIKIRTFLKSIGADHGNDY